MPTYLLKGGVVATWTKENQSRAFKADILIESTTITQIAEDITAPAGAEVIDCTNKWITPGFIDTHRHTWMTVMRGNHGDWLLSEYFVKQSWSTQAAMTAEQVRIGELAGCLEALHSGVTTILDHFHAANTPEIAEACLAAAKESGARVVWCPARQSPATQVLPAVEFAQEEESMRWQLAKLKEWGKHGNKLTEDGRVTLGLSYDVGDIGDEKIHKEIIEVARTIPVAAITAHVVKGPRILTYRDRGLLGPEVVLSHCNELDDHPDPDDEMWAALKETGTAISSTPMDEMGMAHGNPIAFEAVERGVKCSLGADATSINTGDMFTHMRMALQFYRARQNYKVHVEKLTPPAHQRFFAADAFRLATLGGAEALGLADVVGTVEVGKRADMLVFDALSANLAGAAEPFRGIVYHASTEDIEAVLVDGEFVKRGGRLTKFDWAPVARELKLRADEVRAAFPEDKLEKLWQDYCKAHGGSVLKWVE